MKFNFLNIIILFLSNTSMAQMINSFDCAKEHEDSISITYSLKVKFDSTVGKEKRLELVKAELEKNYQIKNDKIIFIEPFIDKKYLIYRYRVKVNKDNNEQVIKGDTYIYEYAIKKTDQAYFGFFITNDTLAIQKCFTIYFSKGKIGNVTEVCCKENIPRKYIKKTDGNIFVEDLNLLCYTSENFISRNKLISDDIYKMISPDFLNMTNKERLKMLDSLVK